MAEALRKAARSRHPATNERGGGRSGDQGWGQPDLGCVRWSSGALSVQTELERDHIPDCLGMPLEHDRGIPLPRERIEDGLIEVRQ